MVQTKQWMIAAILTCCGATMTLTSCVDNVDNPVIPVNPKEEVAKETFLHEDWMDRSVKPEDRVKIW